MRRLLWKTIEIDTEGLQNIALFPWRLADPESMHIKTISHLCTEQPSQHTFWRRRRLARRREPWEGGRESSPERHAAAATAGLARTRGAIFVEEFERTATKERNKRGGGRGGALKSLDWCKENHGNPCALDGRAISGHGEC